MAFDLRRWLLEGDPAIRWQTMRDLKGSARKTYQAERARTASLGWGADLLAHQDGDGGWGGRARFAFPPRWHYDAFRALDYFARAGAVRDPRLGEAIELLRAKRHEDGCWRIQYKYSGRGCHVRILKLEGQRASARRDI